VGFLAILNAGIAFTRVVLTVGVNVLITSGEEISFRENTYSGEELIYDYFCCFILGVFVKRKNRGKRHF
jgi:hypothetical protein